LVGGAGTDTLFGENGNDTFFRGLISAGPTPSDTRGPGGNGGPDGIDDDEAGQFLAGIGFTGELSADVRNGRGPKRQRGICHPSVAFRAPGIAGLIPPRRIAPAGRCASAGVVSGSREPQFVGCARG